MLDQLVDPDEPVRGVTDFDLARGKIMSVEKHIGLDVRCFPYHQSCSFRVMVNCRFGCIREGRVRHDGIAWKRNIDGFLWLRGHGGVPFDCIVFTSVTTLLL